MADFDPSARATYTKAQLEQYFDRISLPPRYRNSPVLTNSSLALTLEHGLPLLSALQRYQLTSIPFENLELHYSSHHTISISPTHLFDKMVGKKAARGGYCMENSTLFFTVLRSLGFDVYSTGARVSHAMQPQSAKSSYKGPRYSGWNHMINIVTMEGRQFHVDVGFSSAGPTRPVELKHGNEWVNVVPEQSSRLVRKVIADTVSRRPDQEMWVYEIRFSEQADWIPGYCYTETEFLPADFAVMSHFTSTSRTSFFTYHVVCLKMLMSEETDGEETCVVGDLTLSAGELKRRFRGKSEPLAKLASEADRIEALKTHFGIELSTPEQEGIVGMLTAL